MIYLLSSEHIFNPPSAGWARVLAAARSFLLSAIARRCAWTWSVCWFPEEGLQRTVLRSELSSADCGGRTETNYTWNSKHVNGKENEAPDLREEERVGFGACWKGNFVGHTLFLAGTSVSLLTSGTREGSRTQGYMFWVLPTIPNLNCFHVGTLEKLENLPPITAETFLEESWGRAGPCAGKERCCSRLFPAVHPLYVFLIMAFQLLAFQLVRISH